MKYESFIKPAIISVAIIITALILGGAFKNRNITQDSISVVSRFLQRFSIYNIVIESYDLPQTEGSHTIQEFQLRCISDEPVELILR